MKRYVNRTTQLLVPEGSGVSLSAWDGLSSYGVHRPSTKGPTHGTWETSIENNVPKAVGESITLLHPFWTVMVEVKPLHVAEIGIAEVVEMYGVVCPLLDHVELDNPG